MGKLWHFSQGKVFMPAGAVRGLRRSGRPPSALLGETSGGKRMPGGKVLKSLLSWHSRQALKLTRHRCGLWQSPQLLWSAMSWMADGSLRLWQLVQATMRSWPLPCGRWQVPQPRLAMW